MSTARVEMQSGDTGGVSTRPVAVGGEGLRVSTLRPRRTLGWSIGLPVVMLFLPLLTVLLWVLDPLGAWPFVAVSAVVVGLLFVTAWVAYRRTKAWLSRYGIVERGFFGFISVVAARDITGVVRVHLYRSNSLDTTDQLFVVCRDGRCSFRMRGRFWDEPTMARVAPILGVEETMRDEPVTLAELRRTDPQLLYWFERRSLARPPVTLT
ncbi:hypothetical protein J7E29_13300 [Streptomyces sp. ISL-90]|nr:hypothetical protein [Streptomyces sp. ISL-90]